MGQKLESRLDDAVVDADTHVAVDAAVKSIARPSGSIGAIANVAERLKDRLALRLSAVCAKPMNWLVRIYRWLVDKGEGTHIHLLKTILLGLRIPVLHALKLLFKLKYPILRRQMIDLHRRRCNGQGSGDLIDLGDLAFDGLTLAEALDRLHHVAKGFQQITDFLEICNIEQRIHLRRLEVELAALRTHMNGTVSGCHSSIDEYRRAEKEGGE